VGEFLVDQGGIDPEARGARVPRELLEVFGDGLVVAPSRLNG
jgi:hypothetical protein